MVREIEALVNDIEIPWHARMWPRAVFDAPSAKGRKGRKIADELEILTKPGVYVLYRDDLPYYIGQASVLMSRLTAHHKPGGRYSLFWNHFSVFVLDSQAERDRIEAILITVFPTVNGATPRIKREKLPREVVKLMRQIRRKEIGIFSREDDSNEE